jgi:hypothetical protein
VRGSRQKSGGGKKKEQEVGDTGVGREKRDNRKQKEG